MSKHHYALELSKNNKVYFLNPPAKTFSIEKISSSLFVVNAKPLFRGMRKLPFVLSSLLTWIEFVFLEKKLEPFDVIWNFENSRFFNLKNLRKNLLKISHIMDMSENFNFKLASQTADICFGVASSIVAQQTGFNPLSFKVNHGLCIQSINHQIEFSSPFDLNACYIGNLQLKYIDWPLLLKLVAINPRIGFHFIGPDRKSNVSKTENFNVEISKLRALENAFLWGEQPSNSIPEYLKSMDILILAYQVEKFPRQVENSHKIMEYLASGKVIISSFIEEYKDKNHLLEMTDNEKDYLVRFQTVSGQLAFYNSKAKRDQRIDFAQEHTYAKQIGKIEAIINDNLNK